MLSDDDALARVRLAVADSGIGIDAEALPSIFLSFEQVGDASHRRGGTGSSGLSISQRLVRLMGGDLVVESTRAQGSLFWFDVALPILGVPDNSPRSVIARSSAMRAGHGGFSSWTIYR